MTSVVCDIINDAAYRSLVRICGGGIKGSSNPSYPQLCGDNKGISPEGDKNSIKPCEEKEQESWLKELKKLAYSSVSFPNGSNDACPISASKNVDIGGKPHDVEVRAALSFYHRYKPRRCDNASGNKKKGASKKRRRSRDSSFLRDNEAMPDMVLNDGTGGKCSSDAIACIPSVASSPAMNLDVVSDMGLVRRIDSPHTLAVLLARIMEEECNQVEGERNMQSKMNGRSQSAKASVQTSSGTCSTSSEEDQRTNTSNSKTHDIDFDADDDIANLDDYVAGDIRPSPSGVICIVTRQRAEMLRSAGRLPCPLCIKWCKGEKGLWWHQQREHGAEYSTATVSASSEVNCFAIVPYRTNQCRDTKNTNSPNTNITNDTEGSTKSEPTRCIRKESGVVVDNFEVVKRGDLDGLLAAIRGGYNPTGDIDKNGASILHWAAGCGHLDIVKFLLETCHLSKEDSQKGKRSYKGRTPLHWAARNGHLNVVVYLVDVSGAEIDATTEDGTTAFCWACWQGHLDVMKYLYSRGCDPHKLNSFGCNAALWSAQGEGSVGSMKWLMFVKCNLFLINSNGHSIVHKAAQRGKDNVCEWLLSSTENCLKMEFLDDSMSGDSLNNLTERLTLVGPDSDGCCPSDLAGMEGHHKLAKLIAKHECMFALHFYQQAKKCAAKQADKNVTDYGAISNEPCLMPTRQIDSFLAHHLLPTWLRRVLVDKKHISAKTYVDEVWEAGGGVWRMASQIIASEVIK